jgi:hypothetical protein
MKVQLLVSACILLAISCAPGKEPLKSGPQPGQDPGGPFPHYVLFINGPFAGGNHLIYYGLRENPKPSVFVFSRNTGEHFVNLVRKLDAEATRSNLFVSVVVISDDKEAPDRLKRLAEKEKIRTVLLSVAEGFKVGGGWRIAKEADVTVVFYTRSPRKVAANFALRAGELGDKTIEPIMREVARHGKQEKEAGPPPNIRSGKLSTPSRPFSVFHPASEGEARWRRSGVESSLSKRLSAIACSSSATGGG